MNKDKAIDYVCNIFHFKRGGDINEYQTEASSSWWSDPVEIYVLDDQITVRVLSAEVVFYKNDDQSTMLRKTVQFICDATMLHWSDQHILSWGFNCNISYIPQLKEALGGEINTWTDAAMGRIRNSRKPVKSSRLVLSAADKDEYLHEMAQYDAERGVCIDEYFTFKDLARDDGYSVGRQDFETYLELYEEYK